MFNKLQQTTQLIEMMSETLTNEIQAEKPLPS